MKGPCQLHTNLYRTYKRLSAPDGSGAERRKKPRRSQSDGRGFPLCHLFILEFLETVGADVFAAEVDDILGIIAENTGGLVLFQDDGGSIYIDLQRVLFGDIQSATELDGKYDSAEFSDLSDNAGRVHSDTSFLVPSMFSYLYLETDIIITLCIAMSIPFWKFRS